MAAAAPASEPYPVADLNTIGTEPSSPGAFVESGEHVFFVADDGVHGAELWRTDATGQAAVLVKDVHPGSEGSFPQWLVDVHGTLFFSAGDGEHGHELWKSDGTEQGTELVRDIRPGADSSLLLYPTALGEILIVRAFDDVHGAELWRSDGSEAGTQLVRDIFPGSQSSSPTPRGVVGGHLLLSADDGVHGSELWSTDGSEAGTVLVKDIHVGGTTSNIQPATAVAGGRLFFAAGDGTHGHELWSSDGSAAGTVLVREIAAGPTSSLPRELTALGARVFFTAYEGVGGAGRELWASDGSEAGTGRVADIVPGAGSPGFAELTAAEGRLFFTAFVAEHGAELWTSDGTAAGTHLVKDIREGPWYSYPEQITAVGPAVFFVADDWSSGAELWRSDGSEAGTSMVRELWPGTADASIAGLAAIGDRVFFAASSDLPDSGAPGSEPWTSDGSEAGTRLVEDVNAVTLGSYPTGLTDLDGRLLFLAHDGRGRKLWTTDATAAGTVAILGSTAEREIRPSPPLTRLAGRALLFVDDGIHGSEPWITDGTEAGTEMVADLLPGDGSSAGRWLAKAGDQAFFTADDGTTGHELWRTDGSAAGTRRVKDIQPGPATSEIQASIAVLDDLLFFSADDGENGHEPWRSDGTEAGTWLLRDLATSSGPFDVNYLGATSDVVLFQADDDVHGDEPWLSDGSPAGTGLLADVWPGSRGSRARASATLGGRVYFNADDDSHGRELWTSDGTTAGTTLVKDIWPGEQDGLNPHWKMLATGDRLFFAAQLEGNDLEPWVSDGTAAGTALVKQIRPGPVGSLPRFLARVGASVYLEADDGVHGRELWVSDGSEPGTRLVADLLPGPGGSDPEQLVVSGGIPYFVATGPRVGREVWALPVDFGDGPGPAAGATDPALGPASHVRVPPSPHLGAAVDSEPLEQAALDADGDDANGDDEDGVHFPAALLPGTATAVQVTASGAGLLSAWLDLNRDGDWHDTGEQIFTDEPLSPGLNLLQFTAPPTATPPRLIARFRFSQGGGLGPSGIAPDGEVEDHPVPVMAGLDWGDAPAPYPTLQAADGARHRMIDDLWLGSGVDAESDGQEDVWALGDDADGGDDEDGVTLTAPLTPWASVEARVIASRAGRLDGWIDFDGDGVWEGGQENVIPSLPVAAGENLLPIVVPTGMANGPIAARFRLSSAGGLAPTGLAEDGEVEDYMFATPIPLIARAGEDQWVGTGTPVVVLGASPVALGGVPPYAYSWTLQPPGGATVTSENDPNPVFSAFEAGLYTATVEVTDAASSTVSDSTTIAVACPEVVDLYNTTLWGRRAYQASELIAAERVDLSWDADVTLAAGGAVLLSDDVQVQAGASLRLLAGLGARCYATPPAAAD